jgi:long-chain acyl-CoA synthetase
MACDCLNTSYISQIPEYWARVAPASPALHEDKRTVSYGALWSAIQQAREILSTRGVTVGDRVMIVGDNCAAQITFLFAAIELHAWPVVVAPYLSSREMESIRAHCTPRVEVFTACVSSVAHEHAECAEAVPISVDHVGHVRLSAPDPFARTEDVDTAKRVAALIYTPSATGAPKGVMVTHKGLLNYARIVSTSRSMTGDDVIYAGMPISHAYGLCTVLLASMYAGASLHLRSCFNAEHFFAAAATQRISILQSTPTMFLGLLAFLADTGKPPMAHYLRYLYAGCAPLNLHLKQQVEAAFDLPLNTGYDMAEYAGSLFITSNERPRQDCAAGYLVQGTQIRIADKFGRPASFGKAGDIWVRGPGMMFGYYRAPALTAEVINQDGWLKTGDIGRLDKDGALFVMGRSQDVITVSGVHVYPIEIEAVLDGYPGIQSSAVVGCKGDSGTEMVAFVVTDSTVEPKSAELKSYLTRHLPPHKRPRAIYKVSAMPNTMGTKLERQALAALANNRGCC